MATVDLFSERFSEKDTLSYLRASIIALFLNGFGNCQISET